MTTKYDALEALATKADPGRWEWVGMNIESGAVTVMEVGDDNKPWGMHSTTMTISAENEAWIVAANPSVALGLIADVKALAEALTKIDDAASNDATCEADSPTWQAIQSARAALARIQGEGK